MDEFQKLKQIFYENILHGLFNYKSTNAEINKLLDKFSDLIFNVRGFYFKHLTNIFKKIRIKNKN